MHFEDPFDFQVRGCGCTCSVWVCQRVNAAPMRRSISWRASTASDSGLLGRTRLAMARLISRGMTAEKRARHTSSRGLAPLHTSSTWPWMQPPISTGHTHATLGEAETTRSGAGAETTHSAHLKGDILALTIAVQPQNELVRVARLAYQRVLEVLHSPLTTPPPQPNHTSLGWWPPWASLGLLGPGRHPPVPPPS